jgi:dethiobiotin synthetase
MLFVTGTDTGCGKTTVGRAILAALRRRGLRLGALKAVETGCEPGPDGDLVPADAVALARAAGIEARASQLCPYRLGLAASPERAAESAGVRIDLEVLRRAVTAARARAEFVIVEGAGGLLVPVADGALMADVALAAGLPLLVVARDALGTVNHTLLTLEAARRRLLPVAGVVMSETAETRRELRNDEAIAARSGVRICGALPYLPRADDEALADAAEAGIDLDFLLGAGSGPGTERREPTPSTGPG